MSFWIRRRLTASNSSPEKSRGWWVCANSTGKPSSGSALKRWMISLKRLLKPVIEYCLEILEEVEAKIPRKTSLARLEATLDLQYAEQYENKVFQYRWALRHPVVKEAITRARGNRFPHRS